MSNLSNRVERLEAQADPQNGAAWIVATYSMDDPDRFTVNGQSMTRAELDEYAARHNISELSIFYLPENGRDNPDPQTNHTRKE